MRHAALGYCAGVTVDRGRNTRADAAARPPLDERSDADLIRDHVAGDPRAFGELVRRHRDRLWAVALRTIGDREEAADAV